MKYLLFLLIACVSVVGSTEVSQAHDECSADGDVSYICDAQNVEDLIHIKDTDWVLAGRLLSGDANDGGFYLININDNSKSDFAPDFSGTAKDRYAACPGRPQCSK